MKVYLLKGDAKTLLGNFRGKMLGESTYGAEKRILSNLGQKFVFKVANENITDTQVGDVFTSYIYKKLGLSEEDYVEYNFVETESRKESLTGVISKFFVPKGAKTISAWDVKVDNFGKEFGWDIEKMKNHPFKDMILKHKTSELIALEFSDGGEYINSAEDVLKQMKIYAKNHNLWLDEKDLDFKLKRMIILDYFFVQKDRHMSNIEFIIDKNTITLAPLFDNELAFGMENKVFLQETLASPQKRFRIKTGLTTAGGSVDSYKTSRLFKNGGIVAVDILDEIKHDKRLKALVDKCLKLDIDEQIQNFDRDVRKLTVNQKKYIKTDFLARRQQFFDVVKTLEKRTNRQDIFTSADSSKLAEDLTK